MSALPRPEAVDALQRLRASIGGVILGKDEVIDRVLAAVLAGGHVLLHDVPGVGKTTLAQALARALGGRFSRVQFTADLLPADLTGVTVLDREGGLRFREGPLFANVVLADEINRSSPKTQSALFEAMEEGTITADGHTHALPAPYLVIATQNPYEAHGTFPLPDSQLDRFLMRLYLGYPSREVERAVIRQEGRGAASVSAAIAPEAMTALREAAAAVAMPARVEDYLLDLVQRTREDPRLLRGVSPRGAQALHRASRAWALVRGRTFVIPEDLRELAVPVLGHRVLVRAAHGAETAGDDAIRALLDGLPSPL